MADSKNSGSPENKELSTETRLLIAFILMGAVLFTTPYFFKSAQPPAPAKKEDTTKSAAAAATPEAQKADTAKAAPPSPAPGQISAQKEQIETVESDIYKIVFSNRGAVVRSWILKKYPDSNGKPLDLVNFAAPPEIGSPFS